MTTFELFVALTIWVGFVFVVVELAHLHDAVKSVNKH
jgi:hypothetical protein